MLQIYWDDGEDGTSLSVEHARQFSELLPSSQTDYLVKDLNPAYKLSIIIVAYFYTEKGKASQSVRGRTYGNGKRTKGYSINYELTSIILSCSPSRSTWLCFSHTF